MALCADTFLNEQFPFDEYISWMCGRNFGVLTLLFNEVRAKNMINITLKAVGLRLSLFTLKH